MGSKFKQIIVLLVYFLSPVIATIFYMMEVPGGFTLNNINSITHHVASILGIFSYIWMCFCILMIIRIKIIEENFSVKGLITFHSFMATVALLFGVIHALLLIIAAEYPDSLVITGTIGGLIFLILIVLAIIFMTNKVVISKLRTVAFKKNFKYSANKVLHNITMLAVFINFVHTLLSFTAMESDIMSGVYFSVFIITFIGWVSHKTVRGLRDEPDKFAYARRDPYVQVPMNIETPTHAPLRIQEADKEWILKLMKHIPSIYSCFQCGSCSAKCPVAEISNGEYNPRLIMEAVLSGQREMVVDRLESDVWLCATCQNCVETCPQDVKLTELFILIKNECFKKRNCPDGYVIQSKIVFENALAIPVSNPIVKRREQLGLSPIKVADVDEIQKLMKETELDMSEEGSSEE